jgi:sugar transferase (PEP-CTERM/EpsH1 system associated)
MRDLLFISHCMPWPPDKGEKIRAWHVIEHLAAEYRVHLGCVVGDPADMAHAAHMRGVCASVGAFAIDRRVQKMRALLRARPGRPLMPDFYYLRALQGWIDATLQREPIEAAYIYTVAMAPYVRRVTRPLRILDAVDIDSEKWAEYAKIARFPMRAVWAREARTLLAYERQAASSCARTYFVSAPEAERFAALAPECAGTVAALDNGIDLARFSPAHAFASPFDGDGNTLVFTGHMDYWPNADAVVWFARDIMPRLPGAAFWIVGANPGADIRALAALPGVHVTGRVDDVRPYVAHASAIVCPLRMARGVQNKVLEGMAMGRVVIASPAAFEGVRAQAGRDLLVADGPEEWVRAISEIQRHAEMGRHARAAMERNYLWATTLNPLRAFLEERLGGMCHPPQTPRH